MITVLMQRARALGKRALHNHPAVYGVARTAFVALRHLMDLLAFKARHPRCFWRDYSRTELDYARTLGFHSQYGQDYFLWSTVFNGKVDGFFVDIGCNHPVQLSNSLWFERRGWQGLAFDPVPRFEDAWAKTRATKFYPVAIGRRAPSRVFIEIHNREGWEAALSGFAECVRAEDMTMYGFTEHVVESRPLGDFLPVGQGIDLLMIDAEGAEQEILQGIDLSQVRPRYVMVENVARLGGDTKLRSLLTRHGYSLQGRLGAADDVFCDVGR